MALRILVLLLLAGAAARAQSAFGSRGQIVPFGTVSYTHVSGGAFGGGDVNQIRIEPGAMWFPVDNIALGGQVLYDFLDVGTALHGVGFEPLVGFGVPLAPQVAFFPRVGMLFTWTFSDGSSSNSITMEGFAPVLFIPAPHFYIGFGPQFSTRVVPSGNAMPTFGLVSEIGGYF